MNLHASLIWTISLLSIICMLLRPRKTPEVLWVGGGALLLVALRLLPWRVAVHAVAEGTDVYFFLTGMMLLAQLAQMHGVFDWLANRAIRQAKGSRARMFTLVYAVGTMVTIFLSNDATAVVLTPAVLAAVKKTKADPMPYLLICAFIANAASFVLPISNPANLVVFHRAIPPLATWLGTFTLASILSIAATYAVLRWSCRRQLAGEIAADLEATPLSEAGKLTLAGIGLVAVLLLATSALGKDLGVPTCVLAAMVAVVLSIRERTRPGAILKEISWSVLPLVAALFILVEAINSVGALQIAQKLLEHVEMWPRAAQCVSAAFAVGLSSNLVNNLPMGLIAGASIHIAHVTGALRHAILVGVDLGPNLSVTGSLATILWLIAIRKEGLDVSAWKFLKTGILVMPPALLLAALAVTLFAR